MIYIFPTPAEWVTIWCTNKYNVAEAAAAPVPAVGNGTVEYNAADTT